MDNRLKELKERYDSIPIPPHLSPIVRETIKKNRRAMRLVPIVAAGLVACLVMFTVGLNVSPAFARSASEIPVIGAVAKVLTWREYWAGGNNMQLNVRVPEVSGLMDSEVEERLNREFNQSADVIIAQFNADMDALKREFGDDFDGHVSTAMDYEVFTNDDNVLSLAMTNLFTGASATVNYQCYTVDKSSGRILDLDTLFMPDTNWQQIISKDILRQMEEQMAEDEMKYYWIAKDDIAPFETIRPDQQFYINSKGKLVILFDKYEVAPGYMGNPRFVIDTELLAPLLVHDAPLR